VAVSIEIRLGEVSGMMNLGIPSIIIKMLRQKFDQQWSVRKSESNADERARMWALLQPARVKMDARLTGPKMTVEEMLSLGEGDVLWFDHLVGKQLELMVNGSHKYRGQVLPVGQKKGFQIEEVCFEEPRQT
jgi:flagellar motor switch protein FliM